MLARSTRLRRLIDLGARKRLDCARLQCFKLMLTGGFDNASQESSLRDMASRKLLGISGNIERLGYHFEHRSMDYSALTSLVVGDTPSIDTALLPSRLAWNLFKPMIIHRLTETGAARSVTDANKMVSSQSRDAGQALAAVCAERKYTCITSF